MFIGDKSALANMPLLAHPALQVSIALLADASAVAVGAVVELRMAGALQAHTFHLQSWFSGSPSMFQVNFCQRALPPFRSLSPFQF